MASYQQGAAYFADLTTEDDGDDQKAPEAWFAADASR